MSLTRLVDATLENIGHFPDAKWEASEVKELLQDVAEYIPSEEQIAEKIRAMKFDDDCRDELDCEESVTDHAEDIARVVVSLFHGGESNESLS